MPYSLLRRKTGRATRASYSVRFWNSDAGRYGPAKSVRAMLEALDWDPGQYSPFQKSAARLVADEWIRRGFVAAKSETKTPLIDYLETFWDWETSEYIKGKLARKKDSIGKAYARNNKSQIMRYVRPRLPPVTLQSVTPAVLERTVLAIREECGLNPRTINKILQAIRIPLAEAFRLGLIARNPACVVRNFGYEEQEKGILNSEEIKALLALEWPDKRYYGAFCLALVAGLRMGEIIGLRRQDLRPASIVVSHSYCKVVGLKGTKTNKAREVPVPSTVIRQLEELAAANPHGGDWIFWIEDNPDRPLVDRYIEQAFYAALARVGIADDRSEKPSPASRQGRRITFHSLRHGCNARLRGVLPDEKLRLLTGHQGIEMTNHYDHLTDLDRAMIIKAQEERFLSLLQS